MPIKPVDTFKLVGENENVYEAIVLMGKRAREINDEIRSELYDKLALFNEFTESEEEMEVNHEQIKISMEYEVKAKPTVQSIAEKLNTDIAFHY